MYDPDMITPWRASYVPVVCVYACIVFYALPRDDRKNDMYKRRVVFRVRLISNETNNGKLAFG